MREFKKPSVVFSKCLGFDKCRYNGLAAKSDEVDKIKEFVDYQTVCPEVEIGLGIPRKSIRLVRPSGQPTRLVQ
jgi:uncharacterized protein YbbK (DUF523 family)